MTESPETADHVSFLRALAMPFRLESLLFVAFTAVFLGLFTGGGLIRLVFAIAAIWLLLVWITQYALQLIDDVANGETAPRAAAIELATSFDDARAWLHPALAVATGVFLLLHPELPRWPVLLAAALLFPASLGACAISGRALDALHPGALAQVIRGLGPWYLVLVLFTAGCALLGLGLARWLDSHILRVAAIEMLLLLVYAAIGGALHLRRVALGFAPRRAPERAAEKAGAARVAARQQFIDGVYRDLRVHEATRALGDATRWLTQAEAHQLPGDLAALLAAGPGWNLPRDFARLLRGLVPVLLARRQPALALQAAEAALGAWPTFAPQAEADTLALADYALQTGRRRTAARLIDNFLAERDAAAGARAPDGAGPGAALQALRERLGVPPTR